MKPLPVLSVLAGLVLTGMLTSSCSILPFTPVSMQPLREPEPVRETAMSQAELQASVIAFANRFIATIAQASSEFEQELPTQEARLEASSRRVYSLMAASEIAAGPNPGAALLDMVVLTSLNRMVWDEYWRPQVFGMPATLIVDAFKDLEADIWNQAGKVMTHTQRDELWEILQEWWINHPNQHAVDYIRFSDFGDIGKKPSLKEIQESGGLLAPIRQATQAVDEIRMTSERAIFLLTKMQLIATYQVELSYKQLMFQPESRNLVNNLEMFSSTTREMKDIIAAIPDRISSQRREAINDAARLLEHERNAVAAMVNTPEIQGLFSQVNGTLEKVERNMEDLDQGLATADHVLEQAERAGIVITELVRSLDRFTDKFASDPAGPEDHPFDINDYTRAMAQLEKSADKLQTLLASASRTDDALAAALADNLNSAAKSHVDHIFLRLIQLCFIVGLLVFCLILAAKFIGRRK